MALFRALIMGIVILASFSSTAFAQLSLNEEKIQDFINRFDQSKPLVCPTSSNPVACETQYKTVTDLLRDMKVKMKELSEAQQSGDTSRFDRARNALREANQLAAKEVTKLRDQYELPARRAVLGGLAQ